MKNTNWVNLMGGVLTLLLMLGFPGVGKGDPAKETAAPEPVEYVIEDIKGSNVQVLEEGEAKWEPAVEGQVVDTGDEIKTGKDSEVSLMLESETSVHLSENSDLKIKQIAANKTGGFVSRLMFMTGKLLADVKKNLQSSSSTFEVEANGVVCGVRGTAFEVNVAGDDSQVSTHEGKVEVAGDNETHLVEAGNFSAFKKGRFQLLRRLDRMDIQRFQRWRALRQIIRQKRMQRIAAIRAHSRQPWRRLHPRMNNTDNNGQQELKKKMKRKLLHGHR